MGRAGRRLAAGVVAVLVVLTVLAAWFVHHQTTTSGCTSARPVIAAAISRPGSRFGLGGGFPALHANSRNVAQAKTLYQTACRLVAVNERPAGPIACPMDIGLVYNIVFMARSGTLATASYHASGCITLSMVMSATGTHLLTYVLGSRAPTLQGPFNGALVAIIGALINPS